MRACMRECMRVREGGREGGSELHWLDGREGGTIKNQSIKTCISQNYRQHYSRE